MFFLSHQIRSDLGGATGTKFDGFCFEVIPGGHEAVFIGAMFEAEGMAYLVAGYHKQVGTAQGRARIDTIAGDNTGGAVQVAEPEDSQSLIAPFFIDISSEVRPTIL